MKYTVIIITILLLARPVLPVINYCINYNYIVKELCDNRLKPELKCNGKCHLKKELGKASENEKPLSEKKSGIQEAEVILYNVTGDFAFNATTFFSLNKNITAYNNLYRYTGSYSFFHPPAIIL